MMMNKEKAAEYFRGDIDCSQIVLAYSAEKVGLDSDTALKLGSAFGGGMWHGETCGCVTGALMAIGAGYGQTEPGDSEGKALLLAKKQQFEERFMTRLKSVIRTDTPVEKIIRDNDVFICPDCGRENVRGLLKETYFVCPQCGHHYKISARARVAYTVDQGTFREISRAISGGNPLGFPDYEEKLAHGGRDQTGQ